MAVVTACACGVAVVAVNVGGTSALQAHYGNFPTNCTLRKYLWDVYQSITEDPFNLAQTLN